MRILGRLIEFILILALLLGLLFVGKRYGNRILALIAPEETTAASETTQPTAETQPASTWTSETANPETQPVLELSILDVIDEEVMPGTAGSSLRAVQAAVQLLDWGVHTGLDTE